MSTKEFVRKFRQEQERILKEFGENGLEGLDEKEVIIASSAVLGKRLCGALRSLNRTIRTVNREKVNR